MKKVLVAIDYGDTAEPVFAQALEYAQAFQAHLQLLSVLNLDTTADESLTFAPYSDGNWTTYADRYRTLEAENLLLLKQLMDKAQAVGVSTEFTQDHGSPGSAICNRAKVWSSDLIIVGSHRRRGLSEMLLGSVSNYVVHHAPCSVLVVHGTAVD